MKLLPIIAIAIGPAPAIAEPPADMENVQDGERQGDCWSTALTTVAMNECYYEELNIAEARLLAYLAGAREKFVDNVNSEYNRDSEADRVAAIAEFDDAQKEWERYRTNYCGSVYYSWKDGTIRGAYSLTCRIRLTNIRTFTIWQDWHSRPCDADPQFPRPELKLLEGFQ